MNTASTSVLLAISELTSFTFVTAWFIASFGFTYFVASISAKFASGPVALPLPKLDFHQLVYLCFSWHTFISASSIEGGWRDRK